MKNLLLSKKLRITDFRLAILDIFNRYENSISTEQIENELGKFDRITLYRTLKIFKENGIIHEITMPGNIKNWLCAPANVRSIIMNTNTFIFIAIRAKSVLCGSTRFQKLG